MTRSGASLSAAILGLLLITGIALTGCAPTGSDSDLVEPSVQQLYPELLTYPDIDVIEDLDYGAESPEVRLDVCLPDEADATVGTNATTETAARAAMLSVHGGSWRQGDKSNVNWRSVCQWLASEGFVAFSLNYGLAPEHPFPAGIDDVKQAVRWLREDTQVARFDIDPERVGAFGGSAGGNLVSLLGLDGEGDLTSGSRVAAVAELSGPVDLTTAGFSLGGVIPAFRQVQLDYLGCTTYSECPQATAASPLYDVDQSDPPFFIGHSLDERIPVQQADALVERLRDHDIPTEYVTVEGTAHSIAMLDADMRDRIAGWLRLRLAPQ